MRKIYSTKQFGTSETARDRSIMLAEYIIAENATVRSAAGEFSISKSTVHKDITTKLREIDPILFQKVDKVLQKNKAERHLRGGKATKEKYMKNAKYICDKV